MVRLWKIVGTFALILFLTGSPASAANLAQDPGFELSTGVSPGYNGFSAAWVLSNTTFNCTINIGQPDFSSPCWDPNPGASGQTAATYVNTGSWGNFLGNPNEGQSSMYQLLSLDPGTYNLSFYWRHNLSYAPGPNDPQLGTLDAFFGTTTANVPNWVGGVNIVTDPQSTTAWALATIPTYTVLSSGTYFIGWRWDSVFGEYAIDDVNVEAVPEPSTFLLVLAPLAGLLYRRSRKS